MESKIFVVLSLDNQKMCLCFLFNFLFSSHLFHFNEIHFNETMYTPWKFSMEPQNRPLEKEKHLPNHHFWVPC